jgi:hypothetical protein
LSYVNVWKGMSLYKGNNYQIQLHENNSLLKTQNNNTTRVKEITIYCPTVATKIWIKCIHNNRLRTLHLIKGWNKFCTCHNSSKCSIALGTDSSKREFLLEIQNGNKTHLVFLLLNGNVEQTYTEVGSLQNLTLAIIYKNQGESLLKDARIVAPGITKTLKNATMCALPFCVYTSLIICKRNCPLKNHVCDLKAEKPYVGTLTFLHEWHCKNIRVDQSI